MYCGAGGGRMWIEEDPDKRVNLLRTDQALETIPEVIAVSCPFCMTMLSDCIGWLIARREKCRIAAGLPARKEPRATG